MATIIYNVLLCKNGDSATLLIEAVTQSTRNGEEHHKLLLAISEYYVAILVAAIAKIYQKIGIRVSVGGNICQS